jgi:hypothetical protein
MVNLFFFCLRLQVDIAGIFCDSLQLQQDKSRSSTMADATPQNTFRGLPLTPEQDAEVRHYIKKNKQRGKRWDTPELTAMKDMLEPSRNEDGEPGATVDETMEPVEANEERNAAMETEGMKEPDVESRTMDSSGSEALCLTASERIHRSLQAKGIARLSFDAQRPFLRRIGDQ